MKSINFIVANTDPIVGKAGAVITGKNGFESVLGQVKPLVTATSQSGANVVFTVQDLHLLYDDNFDCHILEARTDSDLLAVRSQAPDNLVTFSINSKIASAEAGTLDGVVGHDSTLTTVSANITEFDISANTITIFYSTDERAEAIRDKLLPTPFYINLQQIIDARASSSNTYYVSGDLKIKSNTHNVQGFSSTANLAINTSPPLKGLIKTFVNGSATETDTLQYSYTPGDKYIVHNIANTDVQIKTVVEDYAVPHIESLDYLYFYDNEQYVTVNSVSYVSTDSIYNASLTSADFFKVKLDSALSANAASSVFVNISEDLLADIDNIDTTNNIVTVSYNEEEYPYSYNLASENIYNLNPFSLDLFREVDIIDGKLEVPTVAGTYTFKVVSVNELNRTSLPVTKSIQVDDLPLGQVENLTLNEVLFRDRIKGVVTRINGEFDHIPNRNVQEYEVSYKINRLAGTDAHPSGLTDFVTIKLDASGVGSNGKMKFVLNNIDIGPAGNTYELEVRVTPLNGVNKGIFNTKKLELRGKSDRPLPLTFFNTFQTDNTVVFEVEYPVDDQENLNELDILHTEIRLRSPITPIGDAEQRDFAFTNGDTLILIPHPLTRAEIAVENIGEGSFTFSAKTVDTSGSKSASALAKNITVDLPSTSIPIAAWSDSEPNANVIVGKYNKNYGANYFPSFNEADNGGFVYDVDPVTTAVLGVDTPSSNVEDANGSATGWSWSVESNGSITANDLTVTANYASYVTPVRDLGEVVRGSLVVTSTIQTDLRKTWLELSDDLIVGVAEPSPSANVLFDADFEIGSIVGYNNSNYSFSFSNTYGTIIDNSPYTRVFAIVNPGQEVVGEVTPKEDISNIYSYALIAGAINAHAVELSNVYYANGVAIPSGNISGDIAVSNLTADGSSYRLVDLYQYIDEEIERDDYRPDLDIKKNVYVRFSTANVFNEADAGSTKPHGNVNVDLWDPTDLEGNWTKQYFGLKRFRYFQVRVDVNLDKYDGVTANSFLDDLYYQVSSPRKSFTDTVTTTGNILSNVAVDYSSTGFYDPPSVFVQVLSDGSFIGKTSDVTKDGCNVHVVDTTTGNTISTEGLELLVSATGA